MGIRIFTYFGLYNLKTPQTTNDVIPIEVWTMMCRYHRGLGSGCRYHRGIPCGCHYHRCFPMSINIQRKKISFYFKLSFFVCWFCVNLLGELMMIWFHCLLFIPTLELFNGSCGGSTMLNNYLHISSWCIMIDRTGLSTIILYFLLVWIWGCSHLYSIFFYYRFRFSSIFFPYLVL